MIQVPIDQTQVTIDLLAFVPVLTLFSGGGDLLLGGLSALFFIAVLG